MGSPDSEQGRFDDESPQREVVISRGFWLGETPVTQALWQAVMDVNPSHFKDPMRPVEQVSWEDSQKFIGRLGTLSKALEAEDDERFHRSLEEDDEHFRLPSEAEWEYACRAGTTTATYAGEIEIEGENNAPVLDKIAWYRGNSGVDYDLEVFVNSSSWPNKQHEHTRAGTRRVKQKQPNQWGLHDMLGNVWEWCADAADRAADGTVSSDSKGVHRVYRGGSWIHDARLVRAAYRYANHPGYRLHALGFRLARGQGPEGQLPGGR